MIITINLTKAGAARMRAVAVETERTVEDLANCATEEALLDHFVRHRVDDPGRGLG